ncbi:MAG: aspartate aminotransferase family protein [Gammaproteobacteria bacterium]
MSSAALLNPVRDFSAAHLDALHAREAARYVAANPASARLGELAGAHWFAGAPLHWMRDWPLPFPLFVREAEGASLTDVDGHRYADFCLGDTGAMFGHSPPPVAAALAAQAARGLTTMLPSADAAWVGDALARRFGLPLWQIATTASDANRFLLRWVRAATGRRHIVVFDGCYHGAVDDTFARLVDGATRAAPGLLGQVQDVTATTRAVPFNDLDALAAALADGEVAAVLCEPALTNLGMVLPEPGFHAALRALTRRHGTLLVLDETHTLSSGPGGYTHAHGLEPDALVIGKAIAGGLPCAVYGVSAALADAMHAAWRAAPAGRTGIGTTLSANPLQLAALRATLEHVMTEDAYARMTLLAARLADALRAVFARHELDWCVTQIGARCEFQCTARPPRTAVEAEAAAQPAVERLLHLYLLNRGLVITPFHNMMLTSPATSLDAVVALADAVDACLTEAGTPAHAAFAQPPPQR